jgi:hypothetical protein
LERSKASNTYTDGIRATALYKVSKRAGGNLLWMSLVFKDLKTVRGQYAVKKSRITLLAYQNCTIIR